MKKNTEEILTSEVIEEIARSVRQRDWWWKTLRTLRNEFGDGTTGALIKPITQDFERWLTSTYGISIKYSGGMISQDYEIVDEVKHTVFLLKYA